MTSAINTRDTLWSVLDDDGAEVMQIAAPAGADAATVLAIYDSMTSGAATLAMVRADALAALASRRWRAETGGISVDGVAVMTDSGSQAKITGAALAAIQDSGYSLTWKCADGSFVSLNAAQILAIANAARAHVQACFDHEAALAAEIGAAPDIPTIEAIDIDQGWPA